MATIEGIWVERDNSGEAQQNRNKDVQKPLDDALKVDDPALAAGLVEARPGVANKVARCGDAQPVLVLAERGQPLNVLGDAGELPLLAVDAAEEHVLVEHEGLLRVHPAPGAVPLDALLDAAASRVCLCVSSVFLEASGMQDVTWLTR